MTQGGTAPSISTNACWKLVETSAEFQRLEQIDGPYAVEGDRLDAAGRWVWCVVEGPIEQPRVTSNPFVSCELAMSEADRMARQAGWQIVTPYP